MGEEKVVLTKKRWRATRNSWGYKGRAWVKDQEIILDANEKPNKHFELVGDYVEMPSDNPINLSEGMKALSQMPNDLVPKGGMGSSLPPEMKRTIGQTAAQVLKDRK